MNNTIVKTADGRDFTVIKDKTSSKNIINVLENNSTIKDVFLEESKDTYKVKDTKDSQILQCHLKDCPLVPGVILKELFLLHNNKQFSENTTLSFQFHKPVLPNQSITIKEDGIYDMEDNLIMGFSLNSEDIKVSYNIDVNDMVAIMPRPEEELDMYLLQTGSFRFVTGCTFTERAETGKISIGDNIKGFFKVPENYIYTKNSKEQQTIVNPNLLDEMTAQLGSLVVGYDIKAHKAKGKILTFKESIFSLTDISLKPGDTFYVLGTITNITKREISFSYIGKNQNNEEIIRGEITGNVVPKIILKRIK